MLAAVKNSLGIIGRSVFFLGEVLGCVARGRIRWPEVFKQVYEQGVQSLVIVALTSLASGAVMALQGQVMMERFGAREFIAQLVALSLVRELSPIFTALVFSGKAGAGMASELATMGVNNQILASRTLGVDPVEFLVVPRMLACFLVLPVLVVVSELVGIFGGYLTAVTQTGIPGVYYFNQTMSAVGFVDFFSGFFKTFFFAAMIGWICCFQGVSAAGGALGVGRYTTRAVALCYIAVILSNTLLTKIVLMVWN